MTGIPNENVRVYLIERVKPFMGKRVFITDEKNILLNFPDRSVRSFALTDCSNIDNLGFHSGVFTQEPIQPGARVCPRPLPHLKYAEVIGSKDVYIVSGIVSLPKKEYYLILEDHGKQIDEYLAKVSEVKHKTLEATEKLKDIEEREIRTLGEKPSLETMVLESILIYKSTTQIATLP